MMYVSQIIMLYTLNLYSAVFQLYLNKTGRKKNKVKPNETLKEPEENIDEYLNIPGTEKLTGDIKGRNHKRNS